METWRKDVALKVYSSVEIWQHDDFIIPSKFQYFLSKKIRGFSREICQEVWGVTKELCLII